MAKPGDSSLSIILVGTVGSGKSATANTILGGKIFASKISAYPVTKFCQKASRKWKGRDLLVVDTPGLLDTGKSLETTCKEISRCVLDSSPGLHAIILVLQLGRYTDEEQKTVDLVEAVFGEAAMKHMIVLFTHKDRLEGESLHDILETADPKWNSVIQKCGGRYLAFNNRAGEAEKEEQVQELVELIEQTVQDNGGAYFPDPFLKYTDERLKKRMEVLRKSYSDQREKERQIVEEEYARKVSQLLQEKEERLQSNKAKYEEKVRNIRKAAENSVFSQLVENIKNILSSIWHFFQKK